MGEKQAWRGKWENAFRGQQLDSGRKETHVVSVMIEDLLIDAIRDKKYNRPLLHPKPRHISTERYTQKSSGRRGEVFREQEEGIRAEIFAEGVRTRHVIIGTLPCVSIARLNQGANMATNADFDTLRLMGSPESRGKVV